MASLECLFSTPPDELFEKYSISEIKQLRYELQKAIDKKKDELRVLVGGRYRDFIEVIDKIEVMNNLARCITTDIDRVSSQLTELNVKFANEQSCTHDTKSRGKNQIKYTIAILIKLLINIEDQIWYEMNENRFTIATSLLQFAVHIKMTLTLDSSWNIDQDFPVIHDLWNSILKFPVILTQLVEEKLKSSNLNDSMVAECLCALTMLENLHYVDLIKRFLSLRMETLQNTFSFENSSENIPTKIINSYDIFLNTIVALYSCFRNDDENRGIYWKRMDIITDSNSEPVINFVRLDEIDKYGKIYVPTAVQNFRIKISKPVVSIDAHEYNQHVDEWLSSVKNQNTDRIVNLLNRIDSLETLCHLKTDISPLPKEWSLMMEYFNQSGSSNPWYELYEPCIIERVKTLLLHQWIVVYDQICQKINELIELIRENRNRESEDDLHRFFWHSAEDDLQELTLDSNGDAKSLGLTFKSLCLSPNSGNLCLFVEKLMSDTIRELSYVDSDNDLDHEKAKIIKLHQRSCCLELIEKVIKYVEGLATSSNSSLAVIIFFARFLSGIPTLCASLKQCVLLLDDSGEKWSTITMKLQERSLLIWRKWSFSISSDILSDFQSKIASLSSSSFVMKHFPKWNSVKLKGDTEKGKTVESEITVPFQASFPVQNLLNTLTSVIGQTLPPRIIVTEMIDEILNQILTMMDNLPAESISQTIYVQFLFDVRYLLALLVPIENDNFNSSSSATISKMESNIDPVELDTMSSYLFQNVQQFVRKTQGLYGLLINNKPRIVVESTADTTNDPNVTYGGATSVPWFPLLPISTVYPSS